MHSGEDSPWIDLAPAKVLDAHSPDQHRADHRLRAALEFSSIYAAFSVWAYFAWYRNHPEKAQYEIGGDGWFGKNTYAGGADKLGHAWATMVLARGGTLILDGGGWDHTRSALVSAAFADALFFAVEVKDYFYYEFSPGDFTMDTVGALAAIALDLSPRLDELFDFRVQYFPSSQYISNLSPDSPCVKHDPTKPSCSRLNIAEDYSGETYLLMLHLGGIHALRDMQYGEWSRFVDVGVGFGTRNYKPPPSDPMAVRKQELFLGVSLNAQGLFDYFLDKPSKLRKVGHGLFEVFNVPYTALPIIETDRTTTDPASGGA